MSRAVAGTCDPASWPGWGELGQWEDTTGSLQGARQFAERLASQGIRHELDLWGYDVPRDWPSWRAQLAHHMPRYC